MYALQEPTPNFSQDEPMLLNNRAAWEQLGQERDDLTVLCYRAGTAFTAGATLANPLMLLASLPPLRILGKRLQKVSQIYLNMEKLLDEFESQGVFITPRLAVPENSSLDLFV